MPTRVIPKDKFLLELNMKFKSLLALICLILAAYPAFSQVFSVDPIKTGWSYSTSKTETFLWESANPKATLIFIPGGEGHLGLADDKKDIGGFYGATLKPLSNPNETTGILNVVVFDSPYDLISGPGYPSSRATDDHLMRIESVILYYKDKLQKPVWLMGHSNGAVSITEFYKYLQKNKKTDLIQGMIYSSGRNGADFTSDTKNLPVLFLAHKQDGCSRSTNSNSQSVYEALNKVDKAKLEYVLIEGGSAEGDPCRSGYHMFHGANKLAYTAIDAFVSSFYK